MALPAQKKDPVNAFFVRMSHLCMDWLHGFLCQIPTVLYTLVPLTHEPIDIFKNKTATSIELILSGPCGMVS